MRFYWLKDRVSQGQFRVFWEPGGNNLGDYYTKFHSGKHHRIVRPIYQYNKKTSPTTIKGCIEILNYKKTQTEARARTKAESHKTVNQANTAATYRVTWKDQLTSYSSSITRNRQSLENTSPLQKVVRNRDQKARAH